MINNLPLEGVTVIDFSLMASGPYCATVMADLGARVIRVESLRGDDLRTAGPPFPNGDGTYFLAVNRNKECISVDLRKPEGLEIVKKLVAEADIVIENFTPSVPAKLGIDYDSLKAVNPDIVYLAISGYGTTGPYKDRPGLDLVFQGFSGMMSLCGEPEGAPMRSPVVMVDMMSAMYAAYSGMAALWGVKNGKGGQFIDISMLDAAISMQALQFSYFFGCGSKNLARKGNESYTTVTDCFSTSDGYINVSIGFQKHWEFFCQAVDLNELLENPAYGDGAGRQKHQTKLNAYIGEHLKTESTKHWLSILDKAHVPCGPVLTYEQVMEDPQVKHDDIWLDLPHKRGGNIRSIGFPAKFSGFEQVKRCAAPVLGEHTRDILEGLGMQQDAIDALIEQGVVKEAE